MREWGGCIDPRSLLPKRSKQGQADSSSRADERFSCRPFRAHLGRTATQGSACRLHLGLYCRRRFAAASRCNLAGHRATPNAERKWKSSMSSKSTEAWLNELLLGYLGSCRARTSPPIGVLGRLQSIGGTCAECGPLCRWRQLANAYLDASRVLATYPQTDSVRKDVVFGVAPVYTAAVPGPKRQSWLIVNLLMYLHKSGSCR